MYFFGLMVIGASETNKVMQLHSEYGAIGLLTIQALTASMSGH